MSLDQKLNPGNRESLINPHRHCITKFLQLCLVYDSSYFMCIAAEKRVYIFILKNLIYNFDK